MTQHTPPQPGDRRPAPGREALAERIQRLLALVQKHQDLLCAYPAGCLELHFRHESVKSKLVVHPEG